MRPPKPRITKPRLSWRWERGAWVPYYRVTKTVDGKKKERTFKLDWKGDAAELDRLYWRCHSGNDERQQAPAKYTWRELIIAWRSDPRIQGKLADSTKRSYRTTMDAIMAKNGHKDMRRTTRQGLRTVHDQLQATPRKADKYLATVSLLWNYATQKRDWPLGPNPASGIDLYGKQREYLPWPEWMVRKLDDAPETVRIAANLIIGTGQRPSAAIIMRRDAFRGDWMTVTDEKQDQVLEVFCPPRLRDFVAQTPVRGAYVLARNLSQPLGYDAVEKAFRAWRKGLGDDAASYSLHGLRKLAIIQLAEAGCTDAEIQAVTNQSAETVAYYRKLASRRRLSKAAQERRE